VTPANVMETDDRHDGRGVETPDEDAGTSDRSFKYAVIIYAVVEFFAIALALWYKFAR